MYSPDFDQAAKEILQECAAIRLKIPKCSVNSTITKEDWEKGNLLFSILEALWALQGGPTIRVCLAPSGLDCHTDNQMGDHTRLLVTGPVRHVEENIWLLPYHQAVFHTSYGGGLQCHEQDHFLCPDAGKCSQVSFDA